MKNTFYIGIDPSINSTGLTILYDENNGYSNFISEYFYIIKPNKLTKNESVNKHIKYILYNKTDLKDIEDNIEKEKEKTYNIICLVEILYNTVINECNKIDNNADIHICMEGISYGSMHTQSVMDLAGLNYLIRKKFIDNGIDIIAVPPTEIKRYATGKGNAKKDLMIMLFKSIHPDIEAQKLDDVADSYFMSTFAKCYLNNV